MGKICSDNLCSDPGTTFVRPHRGEEMDSEEKMNYALEEPSWYTVLNT